MPPCARRWRSRGVRCGRTPGSPARSDGREPCARWARRSADNPLPFVIPCHRVVRSDGHVGEYGAGGPAAKRAMLRTEGVDPDALERWPTPASDTSATKPRARSATRPAATCGRPARPGPVPDRRRRPRRRASGPAPTAGRSSPRCSVWPIGHRDAVARPARRATTETTGVRQVKASGGSAANRSRTSAVSRSACGPSSSSNSHASS